MAGGPAISWKSSGSRIPVIDRKRRGIDSRMAKVVGMNEKSGSVQSEAERMSVVIENDRDITVFEALLDQVGVAAIEGAITKIKTQSMRRIYAGNIARALGLQRLLLPKIGDAVAVVTVTVEPTRADVALAVEKAKQDAVAEHDRCAAREVREREGRLLEADKLRVETRARIEAVFGPIHARIKRDRQVGS